MKIALIGYGKMGHAIEKNARARGHEIVAIVDLSTSDTIGSAQFMTADVAIEFSTPATALGNCRRTVALGIPLVSGTTAWPADSLAAEARAAGASFLWSSNFSLGVNIFFAVNRRLAAIMDRFPAYTPSMTEVHHIHKLDHPSGTAITLAGQISDAVTRVDGWTEQPDETADGKMLITAERRGEVPGIHSISWSSLADTITITHDARSRDGFALGAVMAAEWLVNHPGVHTIDEVFDF